MTRASYSLPMNRTADPYMKILKLSDHAEAGSAEKFALSMCLDTWTLHGSDGMKHTRWDMYEPQNV
jgi:hypothetical protein